jgi:hypothetical protein
MGRSFRQPSALTVFQLVFIDFLDQSGALQIEQFGRARHIALAALQGLLDHAAFNVGQAVLQ